MNVNEEIAKSYFEEVHGYIVKTNHYFKKIREKGTGPSDIDLVLVHPTSGKFGKRAICSVKGWQSYKIPKKDIFDEEVFREDWNIFEKQETDEGGKIFNSKNFSKILILPPIKTEDKNECIEFCKKKYGIILLDFSDILFELIEHMSEKDRVHRSYDSESLQTLRIVLLNLLQIKDNELILRRKLLEHLNVNRENYELKPYYGQMILKPKKKGE